MRVLVLALAFCTVALSARAETFDVAPLKKWLAGQAAVRTVQADFTQTRTFHSLRDPVASPGHLWFSAPQLFRWELGDPPKTIVLRNAKDSLIIQPLKKRAQTLPPPGSPATPGGRELPVMDFPLAKNYEDFNRRFEVQAILLAGAHCHVEMLPRDPEMRRMLQVAKIDFDTDSGALLAFELVTHDGSSMRNEFTNVRLNAKIDPARFAFDLTGYEVVSGND